MSRRYALLHAGVRRDRSLHPGSLGADWPLAAGSLLGTALDGRRYIGAELLGDRSVASLNPPSYW